MARRYLGMKMAVTFDSDDADSQGVKQRSYAWCGVFCQNTRQNKSERVAVKEHFSTYFNKTELTVMKK